MAPTHSVFEAMFIARLPALPAHFGAPGAGGAYYVIAEMEPRDTRPPDSQSVNGAQSEPVLSHQKLQRHVMRPHHP